MSTGSVIRKTIEPCLAAGGYAFEKNAKTKGLGEIDHRVDFVINKKNESSLVSVMWQQSGGSAEKKVPFQAMSLSKILGDHGNEFERAYLVLGGGGWKYLKFFLSEEFYLTLMLDKRVTIITLEDFISRANKKKL